MSNRIYEDLSILHFRVKKVQVIFVALTVFLLLMFWKVQILDFQKYWKRSELNRLREITVPSQRGLITDRNGVILAKNKASFKVSIIRENCPDLESSYERVAKILELDVDVIKERIEKYRSLPKFQPLVIKDNLSIEEVSRIESRQLEFPELLVEWEPKRDYPFKNFASHVLGYLQEISVEDLTSGKLIDKRAGDLVGMSGIERQYEEELCGSPGLVVEVVDSLGRSVGEVYRYKPLQGSTVRLTLDFELQRKAEELLAGKEGAVVMLNPRNGEILTLASSPSYDPNKFITRFSPQEWQEFIRRTDFPLENRAIRGLYSPGSIFKLVMAMAGLKAKKISENTFFQCSGTILIYGHPFSCWYKPGHGSLNLISAIQHSCNIYFYQLGKMIDIDDIADYAESLGLGKKTGIDIPGEKEGLIPDRNWKQIAREEPWYPGETISVSIGQGPVLVTPVQVAALTAVLANRGRKVIPHLLLEIERKDGIEKTFSNTLPIQFWRDNKIYFEKVIEGMWRSVNAGGTGKGAFIPGFSVCGKTGSTQLVSTKTQDELGIEFKTHSWFTGFAPRENPKIVVTVLVEYGGMGGATAAPLAKELLNLYRKKYD